MNPPSEKVAPKAAPDRNRLALDLSPTVATHLERIARVLGVPRSQVVVNAFLEALPGLLERVDGLEVPAAHQVPAKKGKR